MKDALLNIFTPPTSAPYPATVQQRLSLGVYLAADDAGRILQVNSSLVLLPSQRIIIQAGRVVSLSGPGQNIKTYEV